MVITVITLEEQSGSHKMITSVLGCSFFIIGYHSHVRGSLFFEALLFLCWEGGIVSLSHCKDVIHQHCPPWTPGDFRTAKLRVKGQM
jgi:hypothetical protein